jgi:uncharacterized membrane protein
MFAVTKMFTSAGACSVLKSWASEGTRVPAFKTDERGAVAIISAAAMAAVLGLVGLTIDLARLVSARQKLQRLLDNAVIAAAAAPPGQQPRDVAKAFIKAHPIDGLKLAGIEVTPSSDGLTLIGFTSASLPASLTGPIGLALLDMRVTSVATRTAQKSMSR